MQVQGERSLDQESLIHAVIGKEAWKWRAPDEDGKIQMKKALNDMLPGLDFICWRTGKQNKTKTSDLFILK